jgi:hypothetical protein
MFPSGSPQPVLCSVAENFQDFPTLQMEVVGGRLIDPFLIDEITEGKDMRNVRQLTLSECAAMISPRPYANRYNVLTVTTSALPGISWASGR